MRLLYELNHDIINLIWYPQLTEAGAIMNPSGDSEYVNDGYKIFFVRTILVTQSRFRPPQHLHGVRAPAERVPESGGCAVSE